MEWPFFLFQNIEYEQPAHHRTTPSIHMCTSPYKGSRTAISRSGWIGVISNTESALSPVSFDVSAAGLTTASFNKGTSVGTTFVVDVFNPANGNTGPIRTNTRRTVPEPSSVLLLGSGVLALAAGLRRRLR
jgi:hypothetical protein